MRTRERRCQSAPLVYAGQLETGQTPQSCRGRSRTYAVPAYMQIDTRFLSSDCVDPPGPAVFPSSLVVSIDAKVRRWETRSTQVLRLGGTSFPPGWVTQGRGGCWPLPPRPLRFAGGCPRPGLLQGDRGSMLRKAGACSAGDCGCGKPLRPTDSVQASAQIRWLSHFLGWVHGGTRFTHDPRPTKVSDW